MQLKVKLFNKNILKTVFEWHLWYNNLPLKIFVDISNFHQFFFNVTLLFMPLRDTQHSAVHPALCKLISNGPPKLTNVCIFCVEKTKFDLWQ